MSTSHVIDWLNYSGKKFVRINKISELEIEHLNIIDSSFIITYHGIKILSNDVTGYWYRRGYIERVNFSFTENANMNAIINDLNHIEHKEMYSYLFFILEKDKRIKKIGSFFRANYHKLVQLYYAQQVGLDIPYSELSKETKDGMWITKTFGQIMSHIDSHHFIMNYTNQCSEKIDGNIGLSFFQKNISKRFEIRSFFLHGELFSMAIFSQNNPNTTIDFRRYDRKTPNRTIPFKLPQFVEQKITLLMEKLGLDTGSIDLIYTTDKNYVFLEVNPVGQFGMTSKPCNYSLEKLIAQKL